MYLRVLVLICVVSIGLKDVKNGISNAIAHNSDAKWFRIVGGSRAAKREFPFIASLQNTVCSIPKVY